jgi:hypothetical protein
MMMENGGTWQDAVNAAVMCDDVYPPEYRKQDSIIAMIWRGYADCLKRLHTNQLEIMLKQEFGDDLTSKQLGQMINVMFNGRSALTEEQKKKYDEIQREMEELRTKMEEKLAPNKELFDKLDKKRQDFETKAWRCCFSKSRENILRLFQQQLTLEAYLKWCENPNSEEALPKIPVYYEEYLPEESTWVDDPKYCDSVAQLRFCAVLCKIKDTPEFSNLKGLCAYAKWLVSCNCDKYPCDKIVEPCDPECEVCPGKTPTPVVTPGVTPPPTYTIPPTITPPPTEVTPPTETLPPTTQVLRADASANAESLRDAKGCSSTLTISYNAQDLTGESYPVVKVVLTVNGQLWHDSGTISTVNYQNAVSKEVGCGQTFNIQVTATNKNGQIVNVPGSITTPVP